MSVTVISRKQIIAIAACAMLAAFHIQAGEPEPIITDRPDFVEASTTVGKGVFQARLGHHQPLSFVPERG